MNFFIKILFFFTFIFQSTFALAEVVSKAASQKSISNKTSNPTSSENQFPEPPILKKDDYAIFIEENYQIFKTKKVNELELSLSCFKNGKPKCQAYEFSQIEPKNLTIKYEGFNNLAALHCDLVGGKNLLALDQERNHYNFCQFSDKSLVNSWSMYYKHFRKSSPK